MLTFDPSSSGELGTVRISTNACMRCGKRSIVAVPRDEWEDYQRGNKLIQQALTSLNASQRELLMTGTHPDCWELLFAHSEEDSDSGSLVEERDR